MPLPIVGAHFRKPADEVLGLLPLDQPMKLIREPSNEYDRNAIMVSVDLSTIPARLGDTLADIFSRFGRDFAEELKSSPIFQIGYVPAKLAATIAERFDLLENATADGKLIFDMRGKPVVELLTELPDLEDGGGETEE